MAAFVHDFMRLRSLLLLLVIPFSQAFSSPPPVDLPIREAVSPPFRVEVIARGLEVPWAIEGLPDGALLVTERPGRLRVIRGGTLEPQPVHGVPRVYAENQAGLSDLELHPNYPAQPYLFMTYTHANADGTQNLRLSRFTVKSTGANGRTASSLELSDEKRLIEITPAKDGDQHFGGRIVFGKDGKVYLSTGERHDKERAQDLSQLNGKVLRLNEDGTAADGNPFAGRPDARPEIFSYGHRNPQGMDIQASSGMIVVAEHGPTWTDAPGGGDEINIIERGKNYGWPVIHHRQTREGMESPVLEYTPATAPGGAHFVTGPRYPGWENTLLVTNLKGESLYRITFDGRRPVAQERLLQGQYGRLRAVGQDRDGVVYVGTSNNDGYGNAREEGDVILKLTPVR